MKKFNTEKRTRNCRKYNIISTETKFANVTEINIETQSVRHCKIQWKRNQLDIIKHKQHTEHCSDRPLVAAIRNTGKHL